MKFTISREKIASAMKVVEQAIPGKTTMPVLNNVLLSKTGNRLVLESNSLDMAIQTGVKLDSTDEGDFCILVHSRIIKVIESLSGEEVKFDFDQEKLKLNLKSGKSKFTINCVKADDFPQADFSDKEADLEIGGAEFKRLIRQTVFCTSSPTSGFSKIAYQGVFMELNNGNLRGIGTDMYRASYVLASVNPLKVDEKGVGVIVPAESLKRLAKLVNDADTVYITHGDNFAFYVFGENRIYCSLLDDEYPDIDQVYPKDFKSSTCVDVESVLTVLHRAQLMQVEGKARVFLSLTDSVLNAYSATKMGEMDEDVEAVSSSGDFSKVCFNVPFLQEALKVVDTDLLGISMASGDNEIMILSTVDQEGNSDGRYYYLALPLKQADVL